MIKNGTVVIALLGIVACSTATDPDESATNQASNAIVGGDADTGDPAVVAIGPRRVHCADTVAPFCSGVLIAPRVVLTAAHCFVGLRPGEPFEVLFGSDVTNGGELHGVTRVVTPDGYDGGNGGGDLALLVLSEAATATPAALGPIDVSDVGKTVSIAGFGVTDDGGGIGTKRSGSATIQSVNPSSFRITPSPSMSCEGDSGGPIFLHGASGDTVVGVTSYGDPGCTTFAENARVDVYQSSFIAGVVASVATEAGSTIDPADAPPKSVCSGACASAAQCGPGFDCPGSETGSGQCTLNGLPPGDFAARCTTDDACGSHICARLGSAATSCLCLTPCQGGPPPRDASSDAAPAAAPSSSSGCSCRSAANSQGSSALPFVLLSLIGGAARRRRRLTFANARLRFVRARRHVL